MEPSLSGRVLDAAKNSSAGLALQPVTGEMQHQHVVAPALRKQFLDLRLDHVRGLVTHHLHREAADAGVPEHPPQGRSIRRRGQQVPQCLLLILVVGDDQGSPLAGHAPLSLAA